MTSKKHNHTLRANPRRREEETQKLTAGRQLK